MAGTLDPNDVALGTDIGGTFTDILVLDLRHGRILSSAKVPSTPQDPSDAAIAGVDRLNERTPWRAGAVFHGTTVGTNALIQGRAALTALVTAEGFRDVLALRRQGLSTEFHAGRFVDGRDVGGYPIKSPVIDLIEIGAGGGGWGTPEAAANVTNASDAKEGEA